MTSRLCFTGATCAAGMLLTAAIAVADPVAPSCGATVGPGGSYELTADVGPCDPALGPALNLVGPVTVDMGGHAVTCAGSTELTRGIGVSGAGAALANGAVTGCDQGVELLGDGGHRVERVTVTGYTERGFGISAHGDGNVVARNRVRTCLDGSLDEESAIAITVQGDGNVLRRNVIRPNSCGSGIVIGGDDNAITGNDVGVATEDGYVVNGSRNTLKRNVLEYAHFFGFAVAGADNVLARNVVRRSNNRPAFRIDGESAQIRRNTAQRAGWSGFEVHGDDHVVEGNVAVDGDAGFYAVGTGLRIEGNVAVRNVEGGFAIDGTGNTFTGNTAIANGQSSDSPGVTVLGSDTVVTDNHMLDNYGEGLVVAAGATGNHVEGNVAYGNTIVDLADDNPSCGSTVWIDNDFLTRSQPCIR
jgi:parallel beta-helix repeat protein